MQTTANLWEVLCRDFASEQRAARAEDCCEIGRKFLKTARQVLRQDSVRLCDAIEIVGDVFQAAQKIQEAYELFEEARAKAALIEATASQARLSAKIALLLERLGRIPESRGYAERAVELYESCHDYSQHSMLLNHLGAVCRIQGNFPAAIANYQRAMEVACQFHGSNHPEVAIAMNNLGVAHTEVRDYVQAESLHMQALGLREKAFGPMHPEVAQSMANLAVVYHATKAYDRARSYYKGALQIYKAFRSADDPEMKTLLDNIAALPEQGKKSS